MLSSVITKIKNFFNMNKSEEEKNKKLFKKIFISSDNKEEIKTEEETIREKIKDLIEQRNDLYNYFNEANTINDTETFNLKKAIDGIDEIYDMYIRRLKEIQKEREINNYDER